MKLPPPTKQMDNLLINAHSVALAIPVISQRHRGAIKAKEIIGSLPATTGFQFLKNLIFIAEHLLKSILLKQ